MDFAHGARFDGDEGSAELACDGEGGGVDDLDGAAGDFVGGLLGEVVGVGLVERGEAGAAGDVLRGDVARLGVAGEDPELVSGDVVEGGNVGAEVFGEDGFGVAEEEFRGEEGVFLGEGAVVEDEEEFAALFEGLDAGRGSGWKESHVALFDVVDESFAVFVDGLDSSAAIEHQRPLVGFVPVQFAVGMWEKAHVNTSHCCCIGEIGDILLSRPSSSY